MSIKRCVMVTVNMDGAKIFTLIPWKAFGAYSNAKCTAFIIGSAPKHLQRYLGEMTWRYNRREVGEGDRMNEFLTRVHGRLKYKTLIA